MRAYAEVDVFSAEPLRGNPLAVVLGADGLDAATMRRFAAWTNLSETTFLLPPTDPGADYRVRIFTPEQEYPFAGHPTLGSAAGWLDAGGVPRDPGVVVQECGAGLVRVRRDGDRLAFAAPPCRRTGPLPAAELDALLPQLGLTADDVVAHAWGCNGPEWRMLQLRSDAAVRAVVPRLADPLVDVGLVGLCPDGGPYAYEVRGLAGPVEDPVTGSLNAAVAQWLRGRGLVPASYVATQGSQVDRCGEIFVADDGLDVWIGGRTRVLVRGQAEL